MDIPVYYLIKEVSDKTNINPHTIRYWEKCFPDSLKPLRGMDKNKQRLYTQEDIEILIDIKKMLHTERLSIDQVRGRLSGKDIVTEDNLPAVRKETGINKLIDEVKGVYRTDFDVIHEALDLLLKFNSSIPGNIDKLSNVVSEKLDNIRTDEKLRQELLITEKNICLQKNEIETLKIENIELSLLLNKSEKIKRDIERIFIFFLSGITFLSAVFTVLSII